MSCKVCHSQAVSRPESASSGHLRQCSFGLGQPESHLHGAVKLDGRAQGGTGLLCLSHLVVQGTEPEVAVGLERTHAQLLGQSEGLAVVFSNLIARWRLTQRCNLA
jgi:hypothetical protein